MPATRQTLCQLPTPCHVLPRASKELGIELWIKRDDLTGFAGGGNKGRKIEFLMGDVLAQGATDVVTCGSTQSNFVRQLATACAMFDIRCHAVVMDLPFEPEYGKPKGKHGSLGGNQILNQLVGLNLNHLADGSWDELFEATQEVARKLQSEGKNVYEIPIGGSSAQGAFSFYLAAHELTERFDTIITATSSGSTMAGLATAFNGTETKVIGISCDPEEENREDVLRLSKAMVEWAGTGIPLTQADLRYDFVGEGYGVSSPGAEAAIKWLATKEGIFLDPVYSGKAFDGLIQLAQSGEIKGKVLFWHTGGFPTLFAEERI